MYFCSTKLKNMRKIYLSLAMSAFAFAIGAQTNTDLSPVVKMKSNEFATKFEANKNNYHSQCCLSEKHCQIFLLLASYSQ